MSAFRADLPLGCEATITTSDANFMRTDPALNAGFDKFMELIWRAAGWSLNVNGLNLVEFPGGDPIFFPSMTIHSGEDVEEQDVSTGYTENVIQSAFQGPGDIMCNWRRTRHTYTIEQEIYPGLPYPDNMVRPGSGITWGPGGLWSYDLVTGGGELEGTIDFGVVTDAGGYSLGNIQGDPSSSVPAGVGLRVMRNGIAITDPITLYQNAILGVPFGTWSASGYIELRMIEWHEYPIDGLPTWDRYSGAQLRSPTRRPANGRRTAYIASASAGAP